MEENWREEALQRSKVLGNGGCRRVNWAGESKGDAEGR